MTPPKSISNSGARSRDRARMGARAALLSFLSAMPVAMAQSNCIPLTNSTACQAFSDASISPSGSAVNYL